MRLPRTRSETGIYHVVLRGINRQNLFFDDEDYQHFLDTLGKHRPNCQYDVYGYCLMTNHIHLLINENTSDISRIMKRVGTSYALWYNLKYSRSGHVFQGRFKSEAVENDTYLLTVIRYIHNNPVKAGIVHKPEEYCWSSIHDYYGDGKFRSKLLEVRFVLELFDQDIDRSIQALMEFTNTVNQDECLEEEPQLRKSDKQIREEIEELMGGNPIGMFQNMERKHQNEILNRVKMQEGVSLRQIARVTGLSLSIVYRA